MRLIVGNLGHDFEKDFSTKKILNLHPIELMMRVFCVYYKDVNCNIQ